MDVNISFWMETTHVWSTVPTEEAWVKPRPFAHADCLVVWRLLGDAKCLIQDSPCSQRDSRPFSFSGLSDSVPPRGTFGTCIGISYQWHYLLQQCDIPIKMSTAWETGQTPGRKQAHCSVFEGKWKDKCKVGGAQKHIDLGLWLGWRWI